MPPSKGLSVRAFFVEVVLLADDEVAGIADDLLVFRSRIEREREQREGGVVVRAAFAVDAAVGFDVLQEEIVAQFRLARRGFRAGLRDGIAHHGGERERGDRGFIRGAPGAGLLVLLGFQEGDAAADGEFDLLPEGRMAIGQRALGTAPRSNRQA